MLTFDVCFNVVTPESAALGGIDHGGWIGKGLSLRDALDAVQSTRTSRVEGVECVECDSWPTSAPHWVQVVNGCEFETGAQESRSIHFPDALSAASRRRIARLVGARV